MSTVAQPQNAQVEQPKPAEAKKSSEESPKREIPQIPGAGRLVSLDAFRGLTIAGMTLVNNPGSWSAIYPPLEHATWHGWTPTDLIFPFFLWIVGVSMILSFESRQARGETRERLMHHVIQRAGTIILIGWLMALWPRWDLNVLRLPGVLPRIGVVYLCAGVIVLYCSAKVRVKWTIGLLAGYWLAMRFIPVPGIGAGHWNSPTDNLAAYIDRFFLTGHMWSAQKQLWDPEGILSTFPAIATCLLGAMTGEYLRKTASAKDKAFGLLAIGGAGMAAGELMHWFVMPINKNIWTSSYVVFTAGFAAALLGACLWAVDIKGWKKPFMPAVHFGMNAIAIFVGSGLLAKAMGIYHITSAGKEVTWKGWVWNTLYAPYGQPINASLAFAISYVLLWWLIAWGMYRAKWFIKI